MKMGVHHSLPIIMRKPATLKHTSFPFRC